MPQCEVIFIYRHYDPSPQYPSITQTLNEFILTIWDYHHFTDVEMEARRLSDMLKVTREFVAELGTAPTSRTILALINSLDQNLIVQIPGDICSPGNQGRSNLLTYEMNMFELGSLKRNME